MAIQYTKKSETYGRMVTRIIPTLKLMNSFGPMVGLLRSKAA